MGLYLLDYKGMKVPFFLLSCGAKLEAVGIVLNNSGGERF